MPGIISRWVANILFWVGYKILRISESIAKLADALIQLGLTL